MENKEDNKKEDNKKEDKNNKYIHNIRNLKTLDAQMINNIRYMSDDAKMEIIITFNDTIKGIKDYIDNI